MFGDGSLTFREFAMREPLPLATIHDAVLAYLRGRKDAVLFGSHAVNAYVSEPRMTQDVDIMSNRGEEFADELRAFLNKKFDIAVRVRNIRQGLGFRVYQVRKPENRHLVDVRPVAAFPPFQKVKAIQVVTPPELIASKVICMLSRANTPKGSMDQGDLRRLLLTFPELKQKAGPVTARLTETGCSREVMAAWMELVDQDIQAQVDEDEFDY
jgi:hypothetical protein